MKISFKIILILLTTLFTVNAQAGDNNRKDAKNDDTEKLTQFGKTFKNLPVKTAWVKKQVVIICETIEENDITHFELQRSFNGIDFETIETITTGYIAKNTRSLAFIDSNNKNRSGKSFYRLKAVSANGQEYFTLNAKTRKTGVFNRNNSFAIAAGIESIK